MPKQNISSISFQHDMTKKGWTLVEDVGGTGIPVADLELVSFFKDDEQYAVEEVICQRAKELGINLGQCQAEFLLGRQEEIPTGWQEYYFVFPGTVWRDPVGDLRAPYLRWDGERWHLDFLWYKSDWLDTDRLLRPRKPA